MKISILGSVVPSIVTQSVWQIKINSQHNYCILKTIKVVLKTSFLESLAAIINEGTTQALFFLISFTRESTWHLL